MKRLILCPTCAVAQPVETTEPGVPVLCRKCGEILHVESEPAVAGRPVTILWIDDDPLVLSLGRTILEQHGYRVLTAADGPSGITLATQELPDLLILDVLMPEMTGYEVCQRLRVEPGLGDTPILLMTSLQDPQVDVLGRGIGATFTMSKPADPELIVSTVRELLKRDVGSPLQS